MGNCSGVHPDSLIQFENEPKLELRRTDFDFIKPIGKGGFGKVWKVVRIKMEKYSPPKKC